MNPKDVKKFLAGLGIAGLVAGIGVTTPTLSHGGSG